MTGRVDALMEQVRTLNAEEQAVLLDALREMLASADADWEAGWIRECEDRLAAYDRGELKAVDFDDAMAALKRKHGRA